MPGPWTDAHCHLADSRLAPLIGDVIQRSRRAGVVSWIQGGVGPDDWRRQRKLAEEFGTEVHLAFGLHPWWVAEASEEEVDEALILLEEELPHASALGELGLDTVPKRIVAEGALQRQRRAFEAQLDLVTRVPRPLVLHVVRGHDAVLRELERRAPFARGGIVHAFAGTAAQARRYVELGFYLSLGGALLTRPERARELGAIPVERIVLETDAPDQAPRSWQVAHNEPAYLPRIAEALAPNWGLAGHDLLDQAHHSLQALLSQ